MNHLRKGILPLSVPFIRGDARHTWGRQSMLWNHLQFQWNRTYVTNIYEFVFYPSEHPRYILWIRFRLFLKLSGCYIHLSLWFKGLNVTYSRIVFRILEVMIWGESIYGLLQGIVSALVIGGPFKSIQILCSPVVIERNISWLQGAGVSAVLKPSCITDKEVKKEKNRICFKFVTIY